MSSHDPNHDDTVSQWAVRVETDEAFVNQLREIRAFAEKMYGGEEPALRELIQQLGDDHTAVVDQELIAAVEDRLEALATMERYGLTWECPQIKSIQWDLRRTIERVERED